MSRRFIYSHLKVWDSFALAEEIERTLNLIPKSSGLRLKLVSGFTRRDNAQTKVISQLGEGSAFRVLVSSAVS